MMVGVVREEKGQWRATWLLFILLWRADLLINMARRVATGAL